MGARQDLLQLLAELNGITMLEFGDNAVLRDVDVSDLCTGHRKPDVIEPLHDLLLDLLHLCKLEACPHSADQRLYACNAALQCRGSSSFQHIRTLILGENLRRADENVVLADRQYLAYLLQKFGRSVSDGFALSTTPLHDALVSVDKLFKWKAGGVPLLPQAHCVEDATEAKLVHHHRWVEAVGHLLAVRLDAANVVTLSCPDLGHQIPERLPEVG
mmetsp:Transcript_22856/g.60218  ORF Transcript_22856/g.60218 Transcript_22856/m.60218 type:complete len:216 (+) Transcript_22856:1777-2424(+)